MMWTFIHAGFVELVRKYTFGFYPNFHVFTTSFDPLYCLIWDTYVSNQRMLSIANRLMGWDRKRIVLLKFSKSAYRENPQLLRLGFKIDWVLMHLSAFFFWPDLKQRLKMSKKLTERILFNQG
jgi:hypothetical protein